MYSIRIHGRAGQGAKSMAHIIAAAAFRAGHEVQAFPDYGPERSGAPMRTYVRIADKPIRTTESIKEPDLVIILDKTLEQAAAVRERITHRTVFLTGTGERKYTNTFLLGRLVKHCPMVNEDSLRQEIEKLFASKNQLENIKAFEDGLRTK